MDDFIKEVGITCAILAVAAAGFWLGTLYREQEWTSDCNKLSLHISNHDLYACKKAERVSHEEDSQNRHQDLER